MHEAPATRENRHPDRTGRPAGRRRQIALAAGLLTAVLALSGCGTAGDDGDSGKGADRRAAAPAQRDTVGSAAGSAREGASGSAAQKPNPSAAAHVIRTASLSVEVRSAPEAAAAARATAEAAGGLIADEKTEQVDATRASSHVVLRVPQDEYDSVLRELSGTGKLLSRTSTAKDVTDQVVDVDSRIASQRTSVARVRKLMDRADKLSDVVTLEGELSSRQAALESMLAEQASLKDRTSLATITLNLSEPKPHAKAAAEDGPGFLDALSGGWHVFVTVIKWLTMALGASAPFLAVAAVVVLLWQRLSRRRGKAGPEGE
ncbi:uncharacterized protein DUF4349 [Streptomyces sp. 840.1]|uniref:DUF4349 domain-containing protein n=1 Tax=Streptomyces sp. 840.1 TaxID=2485152 RepID=UPI000F4AA041|nr:DUF4349 domain-containing protein [Streptomyces sp. 840.1]ROQ70454.1 uncharacterized protein DUF4349 [Streptomyces sp. 840.1]